MTQLILDLTQNHKAFFSIEKWQHKKHEHRMFEPHKKPHIIIVMYAEIFCEWHTKGRKKGQENENLSQIPCAAHTQCAKPWNDFVNAFFLSNENMTNETSRPTAQQNNLTTLQNEH